MITYPQTTGHITQEGYVIASGYSGHKAGLFNPVMQSVHDVGPIPRGNYTLRQIRDPEEIKRLKLGPVVYYCEPEGTDWGGGVGTYWTATMPWMFGRNAFYIHWDNVQCNYTASHGCIVLLAAWMFYRVMDGEKLVVVE
jgi:lipoprotein-anchoring transpeptidase ErfK/SrfK